MFLLSCSLSKCLCYIRGDERYSEYSSTLIYLNYIATTSRVGTIKYVIGLRI